MSLFRQTSLALACCSVILTAQAFERKTTDQKIQNVQLTDTVTLSELDGVTLKSVAQALRNKKVALMNFKVYVGEILVPPTTTWDQKPATVEAAPQAGVMMTFLRDVPAKNIAEAFDDSLKENDIKTDTAEIKNFLSQVKKIGDIKEKEMLLIARNQAAGGDKVLVMIPNRFTEVISGPAGWSQHIMKIWTGKPSDAGIKEFQKALFK